MFNQDFVLMIPSLSVEELKQQLPFLSHGAILNLKGWHEDYFKEETMEASFKIKDTEGFQRSL